MATFESLLAQVGKLMDEKLAGSIIPVTSPVVQPPVSTTPPVVVPPTDCTPIKTIDVVEYALPNTPFSTNNSAVKSYEQVAYITPLNKAYKIFLVKFVDDAYRTYRLDESGLLSCGKNIYDNAKVTILPGYTKQYLQSVVKDTNTDFDGLKGVDMAAKL